MIRINLLGEKKDNRAAYALQLLLFSVLTLACLGLCLFVQSGLASEVQGVEAQQLLLESKAKRLREQTKQVTELQAKRKLLAEKLTTIATLKVKKQGPVRVLDYIGSSVPQRVWLIKLNQKGDTLDFSGVALDNQTIADFINRLAKSPYFTSVDLVYSKEYLKDQVPLKEFLLTAKMANILKLSRETKEGTLHSAPAGADANLGAAT